MEFENKDVVMVYDTDYQGVAHYASYYRFVTNALYALVKRNLGNILDKYNIWFVIVESHASYKRPLKVGDEITVKIKTKLLDKKSIRFDFSIYKDNELTTEGYLIQVAISKNLWHAVEMPNEIIELLKD